MQFKRLSVFEKKQRQKLCMCNIETSAFKKLIHTYEKCGVVKIIQWQVSYTNTLSRICVGGKAKKEHQRTKTRIKKKTSTPPSSVYTNTVVKIGVCIYGYLGFLMLFFQILLF